MGQFADSLWVSRQRLLGPSPDHRLWLSAKMWRHPLVSQYSFWSLVIGFMFFNSIQRCRIVQISSHWWFLTWCWSPPQKWHLSILSISVGYTLYDVTKGMDTSLIGAAWTSGFDSVSIQTRGRCNEASALAGGCKHVAKFTGDLWH